MKKVLVSLLVLALAMSSVFAAVNLSGSFTAGYAFNFDSRYTNTDSTLIWGDDKAKTNTLKFDITASDEDGVWSISSGEGTLLLDGRLNANLAVDVMKLFDADSDLSVSLGLAVNDEQSVLRAYANKSGKNFDRARTDADGVWTSLTVGYTDLVQVQVAGSPVTKGFAEDIDGPNSIGDNNGDLVLSVKSVPTEGVAVSAGWVLNGKNDDGTGTEGILAFGVDANVGTLADLGFDLGVSAAYKLGLGPKQHVVAATVYGGVDMVDLAVEYAFLSANTISKPSPYATGAQHYLYVGANFNVVENMALAAYFGANDLGHFKDEWFVGGNVGYTLKGVTFNCAVEYAAGMGRIDDGELSGFSIVPSVKVAF